MSDFSGLEQSFALSSLGSLADAPAASPSIDVPSKRARSFDVPLDEVEFRRVRSADELHAVHQLRAEIQLPGATRADAGFLAREKKEIGTDGSVRSNGVTTSSAR